MSLRQFSHQVHKILIRNFFHLPPEVQRFLPFLIKNKRLESYATIDGVTEALKIMSNYSSLPEKSDFVKTILHENYTELESNFRQYMPLLINFVNENYDL
jgi:acyl carrier protein phosphodiesterase